MNVSRISRIIERDFFGALLGMLLVVVLARFVLLIMEVSSWVLLAMLAIAAWSGAFLAHYSARSGDVMLDSLRSWTPQLRDICLKAMLWLLGTAAVIGVLTVLTASYDILGRVAGTIITTALAAGFLWPLSIMIDRAKSQAAGLLGAASVIVVYVLVIPLIWELDREEEELAVTSLVIGLAAPAGMCCLRMIHLPNSQLAGRVGVGLYSVRALRSRD